MFCCSLPSPQNSSFVTSRFSGSGQDLSQNTGFCILKLHGSVAVPKQIQDFGKVDLTHKDLFETEGIERLKRIIKCDGVGTERLQVFFPWEILDADGRLNCGGDKVWCNLWKRAKAEVDGASKISFVGMSAHPYLEQGLRYLFADKIGKFEFVVANIDNKEFTEQFRDGNDLEAFTPGGRIWQMLRTSRGGQRLQPTRSQRDTRKLIGLSPDAARLPSMTPRYSFEDFIRWEI